mmetsp:Transcript_20582/g.31172  ORF Transcript_20582/g.31172 Transcript_20582/m.31172 type:complete len:522 (-) Transcript_20582:92-1657(-)
MADSMHLLSRRLAQCLLFGTSFYFLILCPHSKVEESFQLQATHDLYYNGWFAENYDHFEYPGVVPRSFVGPSILAVLCHIITAALSSFVDWNPLQVQFLARFLLLMLILWGWFRLAASTNNSWRGTYFLILTAVQFHMPFYASRMLPNTFALGVILHAYASYQSRDIKRAAVGLVVATAIFRCDVILLLFCFGLNWLFRRQLTIVGALQLGITTGAICLFFTVTLDSHLWKYWVWPEGVVFYYNTVLGKSSDWGVSPWHFYCTSAIPKAMLLTIFLVPMSVVRIPEKIVSIAAKIVGRRKASPAGNIHWFDATSYQVLEYLIPTVCFIALYSFLGHKEVRFLFPAFPLLNLAAATGLERFHNLAFGRANAKDKPHLSIERTIGRYLYIAVFINCLLTTLLASLIFAHISKHNYPGGHAIRFLKERLSNKKNSITKVHIDVASAMTGVSLFEQRALPGVIFDKAGYEHQSFSRKSEEYSHLLSEDAEVAGFQIISTSPGRPRLDIRRRQIVTEDTIYVLERI